MQFLSFLFDKHLDKTVLAIAVTASIVLLTRHDESMVNATREISDLLLYPVIKVEGNFSNVKALRTENDSLRVRVAELSHERERLLQYRDERDRLRKLIGLREDPAFSLRPCEVVARSSNRFHHAITIDRGDKDGVRAGMAVVGYQGIVGRVTQVFLHSSRVLLLNNKSISVSCIDKRSRIMGVLEWERGNLFRLEYVGREEDVLPGDTLITSGQGRLFPKGFPVGTVFQVADEWGGFSRRVGVISTTDLNKLEELFVVLGGKDLKDERVFDMMEDVEDRKR